MSGYLPTLFYIPPVMNAPSGTRTIFNMSAAPLAWKQDTTAGLSDCALRVNTSSSGGIGGSTGWSAWYFGGTFNTAAITLSVAQLPVHSHTVNDPTHVASASTGGNSVAVGGGGNSVSSGGSQTYAGPATTTTNSANVSVANAGSGNAFSISLTTPQVKFNDFLIAVKT